MINAPLVYLLDTGVANRVALDHQPTMNRLARSQIIYVPHIVIGELTFGAYLYAHRNNSAKFLTLYDTFYTRYQQQIVTPDEDTARIYGAIYAELTAKGALMQQNDVWIAALARQYHWTLATLDGDFTRISNLAVELF
ncbi:MAG TPA: PIN domain-containing protein [Ktedonobacterales bacterium]|nr:PIN domain-containing protein [Ktedonobacterales bacterium]